MDEPSLWMDIIFERYDSLVVKSHLGEGVFMRDSY